jgi:hypothetical protein
MGRDVGVDAVSAGFERGLEKGESRALAVCAGDVDDRRELRFGIADCIEEPPNPFER